MKKASDVLIGRDKKEKRKNIRRSYLFQNMNKGVLTNADMKQKKYIVFYSVLVLIIIICELIVLVPSVWMILMGFKDSSELYQTPVTFFPKEINLSKLWKLWKQMNFIKYYINTFIMAIGAVAVDIVVCGFAGYVLSRLKPKGSGIIFKICFWLMILPGTGRLVPLYKMFINFPIGHVNMMNTYLPIWIMTGSAVFDIILFKTTFDNISNSLIEASKIDGASNIRIFFQIIIPLGMPVLITQGIFTFNYQFGSFFWPMLLIKDQSKMVLGLQIYKLKDSSMSMDFRMLAMLFSILPQLLVFALFQKYIMGGVNIGGVKG
ncbi:MAG: carbohydrate ABC transporter permease [Clostridia bacterium]|nr:carbohydrate ABC transporter permease [Clostridia bacterium]